MKETKQIPHNQEHTAVEDMQDWEALERVKPPWVPIEHGERVLPPNDQDVQEPITNEMVLQRRDEPVVGGNSSARPLNGRGQDKGASETTRSKQIHQDSGTKGRT
jgi:hypothetical protein